MLIGYQEGTGIGCADSTLERDLVLCEEAGFDIIEIRFDALQGYLLTHSIQDLKSFFAGSRIRPHCMGGQFISENLFDGKTPEEVELDKSVLTRFVAACEICRQIGDPYFLVINHLLNAGTLSRPMDILDRDYPYSRDQVTEFTVRILKKFCSIAEAYGVGISFEPVCGRGGSVKTMDHALEIVNETGFRNIGICLDSFNQYINGKNNDFSIFNVLPPEKIITAHINNCDDLPLGTLAPPHRRFCDSGAIDLDNYLASLKAIGYKGPVSIEVLRPEYYAWPIEKVVKEAYRTTKELVDKYA
jgi:2-keto-myo-inositol isomerase